VLRPCRWVHTIGMRFPLDVAYVDADGIVLRVAHMPRHRMARPVWRAAWIIEAEAGAFERWGLRQGDVVEVRDTDDHPADDRPADDRGNDRALG